MEDKYKSGLFLFMITAVLIMVTQSIPFFHIDETPIGSIDYKVSEIRNLKIIMNGAALVFIAGPLLEFAGMVENKKITNGVYTIAFLALMVGLFFIFSEYRDLHDYFSATARRFRGDMGSGNIKIAPGLYLYLVCFATSMVAGRMTNNNK